MNIKDSSESKFVRNFVVTFVAGIAFVALFVMAIDPYDNLHLSPPLKRGTIAHNQRFSYPALARSDRFDSAVFGTSTTRMINPHDLNEPLQTRFVNLSMNSATWWEQRQMFRLFLRQHPQPERIIIGLDVIWCETQKPGDKLTPRRFPTWMYDENVWNDYLTLFNFKTLETAGEQLAYLLGKRKSRYGLDGYRSLNKTGAPYDIDKARMKIYGRKTAIPPAKALSPPQIDASTRRGWSYPNIATLDDMLATLPANTRILLIFVPYHQHALGAPGGQNMIRYEECKVRIRQMKRHHANLQVMDFMHRSKFTSNDRNYWDTLHVNEPAARRIDRVIVNYWKNQLVERQFFRPL